tara:strand:+ start:3367 stop:3930 length:564 start_codon:yes stop_codon:yes gene_type:complete
MKSHNQQRALFLDRDGVINVDHGYVGKYDEFDFMEGIFDAVLFFQTKGFLPVVVTNQSGIARGYYTESDFEVLMERVQKDFSFHGIHSLPIYFCPHHLDGKIPQYTTKCTCRKPAPGMLLSAAQDLDLDLANSVLVGDSWRDIQAADAAGLKQSFFLSKDNATSEQEAQLSKDHTVTKIASLKELIK